MAKKLKRLGPVVQLARQPICETCQQAEEIFAVGASGTQSPCARQRAEGVANCHRSALYELAAPGTPDEVREQVEVRAANGEAVTVAEIKRLKDEWSDERRGLRDQVTSAKDKAKDVTASLAALNRHVSELEAELAGLRIERDTLRYELDRRAPLPAAQEAPLDTVESQIEALMCDWDRVSQQARDEFLRRVHKSVA